MASIEPRGSAHRCTKCQREFKRADRVIMVHIVEKTCVSPQNPLQMGAMLTGEFEVIHAVCDDPQLDRASTIVVPR